jgi:hypothetical protein
VKLNLFVQVFSWRFFKLLLGKFVPTDSTFQPIIGKWVNDEFIPDNSIDDELSKGPLKGTFIPDYPPSGSEGQPGTLEPGSSKGSVKFEPKVQPNTQCKSITKYIFRET